MKTALLVAGDYPHDEAVLVLSFVELASLRLALVNATTPDNADPVARRLAYSLKMLAEEMGRFRKEDGA